MNGDAASVSAPASSSITSRESRISLPEEAKRYYASIGDSPFSSPAIGSFNSSKPERSVSASRSGSRSRSSSPVKAPMPRVSESPIPMEVQGRDVDPSTSMERSNRMTNEGLAAGLVSQRQGSSSVEGAEFLDMEDEESLYDTGADASISISGQVSVAEDSVADLDLEESELSEVGGQGGQEYGDADSTARGKQRSKRANVEDFPLPPSMTSVAAVQPGSGRAAQTQLQPPTEVPTRSDPQAQARATNERSSSSSDAHPQVNGRSQRRTSKESSRSQMQSQSQQVQQVQQQQQHPAQQAQQQAQAQQQLQPPLTPLTPSSPFPLPLASSGTPHMTFRALPLLASDIPHTQIQVFSSSIRANEKGKDVISFIIAVEPGKGKEGWKVEKLYSDVLGLDSRVRATVGKNVGKKIPVLPEGRLWKDHAPAKVDQRKVSILSFPFSFSFSGVFFSFAFFWPFPLSFSVLRAFCYYPCVYALSICMFVRMCVWFVCAHLLHGPGLSAAFCAIPRWVHVEDPTFWHPHGVLRSAMALMIYE